MNAISRMRVYRTLTPLAILIVCVWLALFISNRKSVAESPPEVNPFDKEPYRYSDHKNDLVVVSFIHFDRFHMHESVTAETIDSNPENEIVISRIDSYFYTRLRNLLSEACHEGRLGATDVNNIRAKIVVGSHQILIDRDGNVNPVFPSLIDDSGCYEKKMSAEKFYEIHHHLRRYVGASDMKILQPRRPLIDQSSPGIPSLPSALTPLSQPAEVPGVMPTK